MIEGACRFLEEYKQAMPTLCRKKPRPVSHWQCPPPGRLKINIDGAYIAEAQKGGVGVVGRDEQGTCVASLARHVPSASLALHMEAEALRAGLLLAIHQGWLEVEVESDCSTLVYALTWGDVILSDIGRILEDCRRYVSSFSSNSVMCIGKQMVWPIDWHTLLVLLV
ncbi:putative ribonuclease H-like domain-containing protein [Rosa chinensis]|uniref:Putative ribonuclease H-like domain-containing protein n=1 Tax=Rosa chinensis TaxID=74649 RepID=A0A2P6PN56_ROSCH|nr:putative ribonuclease H-like domain-containing protein [Rosa chinensis]